MSSKVQMKTALFGLLSLASFGIAQNGMQDTNTFDSDVQPEAIGGNNRLQAAQQFRQPPPGFGSGSRTGGSRFSNPSRLTTSRVGGGGRGGGPGGGRFTSNNNNNEEEFDPSQFDDSQLDDSQLDDQQFDDSQFDDSLLSEGGNNGPYEDSRFSNNQFGGGRGGSRGGNQRLTSSNMRTRPSRPGSSRFQGGGGNQPQSPNQQSRLFPGQPGRPIVFNPPGTRQACPFDDQKGPNILIAEVSVPSTPPTTELDAWGFGDNWCSKSNSIADTQDICSLQDGREFMHVPLTDKFGKIDPICYANFKVWFAGCSYNNDGSLNYDDVVAIMENTDTDDVVIYECKQDSEHRGCLYNGQLPVPTQTDHEAFLICGIQAEP